MPVALVWVAVSAKDLNFCELHNHGGHLASRLSGTKLNGKFSLARKPIARFCAKAALEVSSSNPTSEEVSGFNGFQKLCSIRTDSGSGKSMLSSEQKVYEVVLKQAAMVNREAKVGDDGLLDVKPDLVPPGTLQVLEDAYERCGEVWAEYAKTFYLGTVSCCPSIF